MADLQRQHRRLQRQPAERLGAQGPSPGVSAQGVTLLDVNSLTHFASDLQGPYPYQYTFIEPNYGDITADTYVGGSSQHPMDDVYGGEG